MSAEIATLHLPFITFLQGAGLHYINARSDRESTIAPGHPDFTILKNGRALLIEFKDKGQLSARQKRRIAELESGGNKVHVLRKIEDATRLTIEWANACSAMPLPPRADEYAGLVRFGRAVFSRGSSGEMTRLRTATETDQVNIPLLKIA